MDGTTTVDVIVQFMATPWPLVHIRYLMQEVSVWKSDQLQSVATNSRYLVGGHIVRQISDLFDRGPAGLEAYRLQGKTSTTFGVNIRRLPVTGVCGFWSTLDPGLSSGRCRAANRPRSTSLVGGAGSSLAAGAGILLEQVDIAEWTGGESVSARVQEGQARGPDHWRGGAVARWTAGLANVHSIPRPGFGPCIDGQGLGVVGPASVATHRLRAKRQLRRRRRDPPGECDGMAKSPNAAGR